MPQPILLPIEAAGLTREDKIYQLQQHTLSEHEKLLTKHNNINNQYLLSSGAGSNTFIPAAIISALNEK